MLETALNEATGQVEIGVPRDRDGTFVPQITDKAVDEMQEWSNRPLRSVYAAVFIDAIVVKVRRWSSREPYRSVPRSVSLWPGNQRRVLPGLRRFEGATRLVAKSCGALAT